MYKDFPKYAELRRTMKPTPACRALGYDGRDEMLEIAFRLGKYEIGTVALWAAGEITDQVVHQRYESLPSTIEDRQAGEMFYYVMGKLWEGVA